MTTTTYTRGSLPLLENRRQTFGLPRTDEELAALAVASHGADIESGDLETVDGGWHDPPDGGAGFGWTIYARAHLFDPSWADHPADVHNDHRAVLRWTDGVCQECVVVAPDLDTARFWLDLLKVYVDHDRFFGAPTIDRAHDYGSGSRPRPLEPDADQEADTGGMLRAGALADLLTRVHPRTLVVVATDGWFTNIGAVGVPLETADPAYDDTRYCALTLFPTDPPSFDARDC